LTNPQKNCTPQKNEGGLFAMSEIKGKLRQKKNGYWVESLTLALDNVYNLEGKLNHITQRN